MAATVLMLEMGDETTETVTVIRTTINAAVTVGFILTFILLAYEANILFH